MVFSPGQDTAAPGCFQEVGRAGGLQLPISSSKIGGWAHVPTLGVMTMTCTGRMASVKEDQRSETLIRTLDFPLS